MTFAQSTEDLASLSRYLPHLRALGQREDELNPTFMDQRADVLLRLAYTRLKGWLGLELSDSSSDPVVKVDDGEIENGELDESEDAGAGVGTA